MLVMPKFSSEGQYLNNLPYTMLCENNRLDLIVVDDHFYFPKYVEAFDSWWNVEFLLL
jgi:hypothetical protein